MPCDRRVELLAAVDFKPDEVRKAILERLQEWDVLEQSGVLIAIHKPSRGRVEIRASEVRADKVAEGVLRKSVIERRIVERAKAYGFKVSVKAGKLYVRR